MDYTAMGNAYSVLRLLCTSNPQIHLGVIYRIRLQRIMLKLLVKKHIRPLYRQRPDLSDENQAQNELVGYVQDTFTAYNVETLNEVKACKASLCITPGFIRVIKQ